jgi:hypothetical protein
MNVFVSIAMFGWPVVALGFFLTLPPRRAALASMLLGFMFLPIAEIKLGVGLPLLTKMMVVSWSTMIGSAAVDGRRILAFRPKWVDVPMIVWCLCPMASSLSNDLGFHDGLTAILWKTSSWGVPYFVGRLYFSSLIGMTELAKGVFFGVLVYAPLCLFEIRMSPQLHTWVYGYHQHDWAQTLRYGGYRPTVFMAHGIMVSTWIAMGTLAAAALWWSGIIKRVWRIPMLWILPGLMFTTLLCKSLGAFVLMMAGLGLIWLCRVVPSKGLLVALALLPPLFLAVRIPRVVSANDVTRSDSIVGEERSGSLKFRLLNEDFLVDKALRRPIFGWGGWGRARIHDVQGNDITVTDSLWIIILGNEGFLGLLAMVAVFLLPVYGLFRTLPNPASWSHRFAAPAVFCCIMAQMFVIDCLFNDMDNPAYLMAMGGLTALRLGTIRKRAPKPVGVEGMPWAPRP